MANVVLGIFSPHRFELPEYGGYNVRILKDNFRLLEVIINRGGSPGGTIGLYFNGKCNFFSELPKPNTPEIDRVYQKLQNKTAKLFMSFEVKNFINKLIN